MRVGGVKNQMITLTEGELGKLKQCANRADRQKGEEKLHLFLTTVWGMLHSQITERMQEMENLIQHDIKAKLDVMCETFRVDIGSLWLNFQDKQQILEQDLRYVANAVDGLLIGNNERNNQQEYLLSQLSEAAIGLKEEMIESRNDTIQIQEKQMRIEQKIEEEKLR